MDTTLLWPNKRLLNAVGVAMNISIIAAFTLTQYAFMPILANDLIANLQNPIFDTGQVSLQILSETSSQSASKKFDENTKKKYPKGIITDVDKGIKHIKLVKYYDGKPVRINVVEIDKKLAKDYEVFPALASDKLNNKLKISDIAKNTNSIVAINGTFFKPQTGVPLGTLMINQKLYTGPIYDRVAMGIFNEGYDMARITLNASLHTNNQIIKIDNFNQPRILSNYVLCYSEDWGNTAPPTPKYGIQVQIKDNYITKITSNSALEIPASGYVIVGPAEKLQNMKIGDKVQIKINTIPKWEKVKHIISGGPYLVKEGEVFVDMSAEKLGAIGGKNPRSAIGYTKDGNLILVAVDGREGRSVGMTLMQLAKFMQSIGCVNAMNLDGGGSTVMFVNGKIVNNPQEKNGISISNALVISKKS